MEKSWIFLRSAHKTAIGKLQDITAAAMMIPDRLKVLKTQRCPLEVMLVYDRWHTANPLRCSHIDEVTQEHSGLMSEHPSLTALYFLSRPL